MVVLDLSIQIQPLWTMNGFVQNALAINHIFVIDSSVVDWRVGESAMLPYFCLYTFQIFFDHESV